MLRPIFILLPPLLVFGLYHLLAWINVGGFQRRSWWKRVGMASATAHTLMAFGLLIVFFLDYRSMGSLTAPGAGLSTFILGSAEFWQMVVVFDTVAAGVLAALLAGLDYVGLGAGPILPVTVLVVLIVGGAQWYLIGGGVGALVERVWSGLKTQDEDGPDWL